MRTRKGRLHYFWRTCKYWEFEIEPNFFETAEVLVHTGQRATGNFKYDPIAKYLLPCDKPHFEVFLHLLFLDYFWITFGKFIRIVFAGERSYFTTNSNLGTPVTCLPSKFEPISHRFGILRTGSSLNAPERNWIRRTPTEFFVQRSCTSFLVFEKPVLLQYFFHCNWLKHHSAEVFSKDLESFLATSIRAWISYCSCVQNEFCRLSWRKTLCMVVVCKPHRIHTVGQAVALRFCLGFADCWVVCGSSGADSGLRLSQQDHTAKKLKLCPLQKAETPGRKHAARKAALRRSTNVWKRTQLSTSRH